MENEQYDALLLYYAISLVAELKYNIPLKHAYDLVYEEVWSNAYEDGDIEDEDDELTDSQIRKYCKIDIDAFAKAIAIRSDVISDESKDTKKDEPKPIGRQIMEILERLGVKATPEQLNKIISGDLSINDLLNIEAMGIWKALFGKKNKVRRNVYRKINECAQIYLYNTITASIIQKQIDNSPLNKKDKPRKGEKTKETKETKEVKENKEKRESKEETLQELIEKRRKAKIYIARLNGYDLDRDGDGVLGIDLSTGEVIDIDDIIMARNGKKSTFMEMSIEK